MVTPPEKFNLEERRTNWDTFYRERVIEQVPWYTHDLDSDLDKEIKSRNISGGAFLDLGTGPGTQAFCLAKLGFDTTASDISSYAINDARKRFPGVNFVEDDILDSQFTENKFNYIFDRGCLHVFKSEQRLAYLFHITRILKEGGLLFLKCMSKEENGPHKGPSKFSAEEIAEFFSLKFDVKSISNTVYQGTLDPLPKALFAVIEKKL